MDLILSDFTSVFYDAFGRRMVQRIIAGGLNWHAPEGKKPSLK
jgi:hypothetical protein